MVMDIIGRGIYGKYWTDGEMMGFIRSGVE